MEKPMSMIERVGNALEEVQLFSRWNDWTSDKVDGMPIEICRHGAEGEDEIVVVKRFDASWKEPDALRVTIKDALAKAAIEAMREPTEAMVEASAAIYGDNYLYRYEYSKDQWRAMIDAALKGEKS